MLGSVFLVGIKDIFTHPALSDQREQGSWPGKDHDYITPLIENKCISLPVKLSWWSEFVSGTSGNLLVKTHCWYAEYHSHSLNSPMNVKALDGIPLGARKVTKHTFPLQLHTGVLQGKTLLFIITKSPHNPVILVIVINLNPPPPVIHPWSHHLIEERWAVIHLFEALFFSLLSFYPHRKPGTPERSENHQHLILMRVKYSAKPRPLNYLLTDPGIGLLSYWQAPLPLKCMCTPFYSQKLKPWKNTLLRLWLMFTYAHPHHLLSWVSSSWKRKMVNSGHI